MYVRCVKTHWNCYKSYCDLTFFLISALSTVQCGPWQPIWPIEWWYHHNFVRNLDLDGSIQKKKTLNCIFIFIGSAMVLCHWPSEVIEAIMASNLTLFHHHTTSATMEITLRWRPRESVLRSIWRPRGRRCYGLERLHKGAFSRDF